MTTTVRGEPLGKKGGEDGEEKERVGREEDGEGSNVHFEKV